MYWPGVLVLWLFQRKHQLLFTNRSRSTYIMVTPLCFCKDQSYRDASFNIVCWTSTLPRIAFVYARLFLDLHPARFLSDRSFSLMNLVHGSVQSGRKWLTEHGMDFERMHCVATAENSRFNWGIEILIGSDQIVWLLWCQVMLKLQFTCRTTFTVITVVKYIRA